MTFFSGMLAIVCVCTLRVGLGGNCVCLWQGGDVYDGVT